MTDVIERVRALVGDATRNPEHFVAHDPAGYVSDWQANAVMAALLEYPGLLAELAEIADAQKSLS